ncbi:hypothetical protein TMatcc_001498 [Talaromyces marneffei ATCC 18224]|uniref:Uncharacterized protein n=2 Tax=Talaromyces marneffei TaxID=37727 RepID=B6QH01_TALMQ|nr:uncharacterized protein EYB26_007271 [Talaromyces marneffei]EEA22657.1 conserved hypothetical protein [Talaromyces marneffei ATCC 18224]QGA19582.1 hypothetical protein EYB26_007271 [Talaromyces marneffei]
MGGSSSPPFLYDPVSQWSFNDYHRGKPFNPKAVTQASWTPRPQSTPQEGPLVNFNRHPDTLATPRQNSPIKPMSRHTKARVTHTRRFQLLLRILSLLGAIGILFCVICINHTDVSFGWIIRVAPSVAILHNIYAIYHLVRSAASRPPGSSTSYHLFASIMDAGLVPFYAFISFVAHKEFHDGYYNWGTVFDDEKLEHYIVESLFYASAGVGGLHLVSLMISIYLAIVFRQITKLPPDMNPLEDNLTARPSTRRSKLSRSELSEKKHMSTSTVDSAYFSVMSHLDDVINEVPQPIPFMHTRQQSSTSLADPKRASRTSLHSNQQSARVYNGENQPASPSRAAVQTPQKSPSRPRSILEDAPVLRPTSSGLTPSNLRWSSPVPSEASANWVSYESPEDEDVIIRESKPPSRSKNGTPFPMSNGANDWLAPVPKFGRVESGIPHNEARGQYAALETNDGYDNDVHFDINKDSLEEDITEYLNRALDPLRMNPPTPQPKEDAENTNAGSRPSSLRRAVLGEIPDVSAVRNNTNIADAVVADDTELPASKPAKLRTFGSLRLWGSKSNKTTYASVKEDEASDNESDNENEASQPARLRTPKRRTTQNTVTEKEADRKGRVVSNSGIDLGSAYHTGMDSEQYSEYISTLGVGRRRDVSGKIAEEGRGGIAEVTETPEVPRTPEKKQNTTRAAGWARFAGL